jgi:hypothetical protein
MAKRRLSMPYKGPVRLHLVQGAGFFGEGNSYALAENLTPEANSRRFAGLRKTWKRHAELRAVGKRKMSKSKEKAKLRSPRIRLRTTVAREAREIQNMARTHATQAMKRMAEIVNDPNAPDNIAVAAAEVIFNRAYGKPNQTNTNLNVDANGKLTEVSSTELNERVEEALRRVEAIAGRTAKTVKGKEQPADLRKLDRNPHGPDERLN